MSKHRSARAACGLSLQRAWAMRALPSRLTAAALLVGAAQGAWGTEATAPSTAPATWPLAGRQGIVQMVIVPGDRLTDLAAYRAQIERLCTPDRTCFVNFYANTAGAPLGVPLAESIAAEPTARFRRSIKNGVELFQWSCRMKIEGGECF